MNYISGLLDNLAMKSLDVDDAPSYSMSVCVSFFVIYKPVPQIQIM